MLVTAPLLDLPSQHRDAAAAEERQRLAGKSRLNNSSVQNTPSAQTNTAGAEGVSADPAQPHRCNCQRLLVWKSAAGTVRAAPECIPRQVSMARGGEA